MHARAAALISLLDLRPHPEGGFYREIFRSTASVTPADRRGPRAALTSIYFLLPEGTFSRWHRVRSDELWHFYEGDPLELLEVDASRCDLARHRLGPLGDDGAAVQAIPAESWQAARPLGAYTLVGCTVAPGFDFADFRLLADEPEVAAVVRSKWPDVAFLI